jgi:cytidylate kinase
MSDRPAMIERYLRARGREDRAREAAAVAASRGMPRPFVTISRQAGAGGHHLAEAMLVLFDSQPDTEVFGGWQIFDQRLCEIVADDRRFASSMDALVTEEYRTGTDNLLRQLFGARVDQDVLMDRVFRVVRDLAGIGKAIIIGRAGSHVTQDLPGGLHLRLVGPEDERLTRMMDFYGLDEGEARADMHRRDADRARLLKKHFGVDIDDPAGYDITWNTGKVGFDEIARTTVELLRARVVEA